MARQWGTRRGFGAIFRGARARGSDAPAPENEDSAATGLIDPATIQVFAHTLMSDLFGAGLRVENLRTSAPVELRSELEEIADQIDKAIHSLRVFAFSRRT